MAEAIAGDVSQQLRQALAEAGEPGFGFQRPRAIGDAVFGKGKHQVHVGAEIQFVPAQLAQAEHHQRLHLAVGVAHQAVGLFKRPDQGLHAGLKGLVGDAAGAGKGGIDVVEAHDVAPDQAR